MKILFFFGYFMLRIRRVSRSKKTHILQLRHILTIRDAFVPWIWRNVLCVVIVAVVAVVRAMETTEITPTIEIDLSMRTETGSLSDTSTRPFVFTGIPIPIMEIPMRTESDTSTRPFVFTGMPIPIMETTEIPTVVLAAVADARTALQIPAADSQPPCLRAVYLENRELSISIEKEPGEFPSVLCLGYKKIRIKRLCVLTLRKR